MERVNLKPTHKPVQNYYEALRQFHAIGVSHEGAVRSAFQTLLEHCGKHFKWKLVPEWPIKRDRAASLRVDGALVDEYSLTHGFWEAKDSHDDLAKEVKKKLAAGYPQHNIIFQSPDRAILVQDDRVVLDVDISEPVVLVEVLKRFLEYATPDYQTWNDAVTHFQDQVPELGRALAELISRAGGFRRRSSKSAGQSSFHGLSPARKPHHGGQSIAAGQTTVPNHRELDLAASPREVGALVIECDPRIPGNQSYLVCARGLP